MFTGGILHIFTKTVGKKKEPLFAVLLSWAFVQASCVYCVSVLANQHVYISAVVVIREVIVFYLYFTFAVHFVDWQSQCNCSTSNNVLSAILRSCQSCLLCT